LSYLNVGGRGDRGALLNGLAKKKGEGKGETIIMHDTLYLGGPGFLGLPIKRVSRASKGNKMRPYTSLSLPFLEVAGEREGLATTPMGKKRKREEGSKRGQGINELVTFLDPSEGGPLSLLGEEKGGERRKRKGGDAISVVFPGGRGGAFAFQRLEEREKLQAWISGKGGGKGQVSLLERGLRKEKGGIFLSAEWEKRRRVRIVAERREKGGEKAL